MVYICSIGTSYGLGMSVTAAEGAADRGGHMRRLMRGLGRLMPQDPSGERRAAVRMIRRMELAKDWLRGGPLRRGVQRLRTGAPGR